MNRTALNVDALANEIRRVDGDDEASLSAGALAEALMPFLSASMAGPEGWKPAPYKSTAEMTNAFSATVKELQAAGNDPLQFPATLFHAMLAAAPSFPPAEQNDVTPSSSHASHAPAPALPEAKPVASPAEGEADTKFLSILANDPNAVHINLLRGSLARPSLAQIIHIYGADALREALAASLDREAATREAVIEECAKAAKTALAKFACDQSADRAMHEVIEAYEYAAALADKAVRALAQQAKPQQEVNNGTTSPTADRTVEAKP